MRLFVLSVQLLANSYDVYMRERVVDALIARAREIDAHILLRSLLCNIFIEQTVCDGH